MRVEERRDSAGQEGAASAWTRIEQIEATKRALRQDEDNASKRKRFAETKIGYVHIDACELRSAEGKVFLFLAIDRVSKFTYVELHPAANMATGAAFPRSVIEAFPYRIHALLTDNGTPFADTDAMICGEAFAQVAGPRAACALGNSAHHAAGQIR